MTQILSVLPPILIVKASVFLVVKIFITIKYEGTKYTGEESQSLQSRRVFIMLCIALHNTLVCKNQRVVKWSIAGFSSFSRTLVSCLRRCAQDSDRLNLPDLIHLTLLEPLLLRIAQARQAFLSHHSVFYVLPYAFLWQGSWLSNREPPKFLSRMHILQ